MINERSSRLCVLNIYSSFIQEEQQRIKSNLSLITSINLPDILKSMSFGFWNGMTIKKIYFLSSECKIALEI